MIDKHEYEGEMLVKSPAMFEGYLNRPEATKECFTDDGWFRTGDCAFRTVDGYYKILGRLS